MSYALLVLEDGTAFWGRAVGALGQTVGEIVFNTAMTGYQEILTDPSYTRQLITLTYPHIGNVGINAKDEEARFIHASGIIIRDLSILASNHRKEMTLATYLKKHEVIAIADIDTRQLTHHLRQKGAQPGCIITAETQYELREQYDAAWQAAREFSGLKGRDLAKEVTCKTSYVFAEGQKNSISGRLLHVVAYDFGIKQNILHILAQLGCRITVVPATTQAHHVLDLKPDGIFLSNGPGDPAACLYAIEAIKVFLETNIPLFGICLGHQLLALALGAQTVKMKYGHHGANHPVKELNTGAVHITSQNHGFAVDESSLPKGVIATHRSLFDGSLQGIQHIQKPVFGFQGHPEASPGPHDIDYLFTQFIDQMIQSTSLIQPQGA